MRINTWTRQQVFWSNYWTNRNQSEYLRYRETTRGAAANATAATTAARERNSTAASTTACSAVDTSYGGSTGAGTRAFSAIAASSREEEVKGATHHRGGSCFSLVEWWSPCRCVLLCGQTEIGRDGCGKKAGAARGGQYADSDRFCRSAFAGANS